jgi:glycosyltransferase involved in cell wall biosynthesis
MYNSEKTIISTLDSVKSQTVFEKILEIIIINDGSTDASLELVKKYAKKNINIPISIIDKQNGGVSSARNSGIKVAKGNWIALLDSDDEWLPTKLEVQTKVLEENPCIDFLGCDVNNIRLKILWRKINTLYKANIKDLCIKSFPATPTILFRKNIIEKIGLFDENQKYAEDGNYYMKICTNFNYYYDPISLVNIGFGKAAFGESGLSANLKGMYEGNVKNIRELKTGSIISRKFYIFLRMFYWMKYIRRIVITKSR